MTRQICQRLPAGDGLFHRAYRSADGLGDGTPLAAPPRKSQFRAIARRPPSVLRRAFAIAARGRRATNRYRHAECVFHFVSRAEGFTGVC